MSDLLKPTARDIRFLTLYGITEADYTRVWTVQGGLCAICRRAPKNNRLAVDHDHATGLFRGLLCWGCNKALQLLGDNALNARRMENYLVMPPSTCLDAIHTGREGRATRKWRTKREQRERMGWVVAELTRRGYAVPKRLLHFKV